MRTQGILGEFDVKYIREDFLVRFIPGRVAAPAERQRGSRAEIIFHHNLIQWVSYHFTSQFSIAILNYQKETCGEQSQQNNIFQKTKHIIETYILWYVLMVIHIYIYKCITIIIIIIIIIILLFLSSSLLLIIIIYIYILLYSYYLYYVIIYIIILLYILIHIYI